MTTIAAETQQDTQRDWTRALLTGFLLVAAFLLSFGALRHRALVAGIIHGDLGVPVPLAEDVLLSAHTLAGIWALTLDGLTAVGVLGVRRPETRDWRSWAALVGGLGLSLWIQTYGYDTWLARGMAAVPPVALAMAIWIFEVPSSRHQVAVAEAVQVGGDRVGPPDGNAGRAAGPAGNHPANQVGIPAAPPQSPQRTAEPAATGGERKVESGNLPDPPRSVKDRDPTVTVTAKGTPLPEKDHAALYRVRGDRERFERIILSRGLDRDLAYATAERNRWPVGNGTREEAHA